MTGPNLPPAAAASTGAASLQLLQSKQIDLAKSELERITDLVNAGALPRVRLEDAEQNLADAQDDAILSRTLYGEIPVQNLSEQMGDEMVAAAQRRVERQIVKFTHGQKLVHDGIAAKSSLDPVLEELNTRRMHLNLAHSRARLIGDLSAIARYEQSLQSIQQSTHIQPFTDFTFKSMVHYEGSGIFNTGRDLKVLETAFARRFEHSLPISAEGQTAVHDALGFDHRGRVDVALNPNALEGVWLRHYLETKHIPYYAFLRAIPGSATGAHIHIGPGSLRLHNAD